MTAHLAALPLPYPFELQFMQRALAAGLVVGAFAPMIGTFLVQKRMSLIGDGIGQAVIDGGEPRGVGVAEIAHLHRRGLARENGETIVGGVPGEIDEDVDAVLADHVGDAIVGNVADHAPGAGGGAEAIGGGVFMGLLGVAEDLEGGAVVSANLGVHPYHGTGYRFEIYGTEGTLTMVGGARKRMNSANRKAEGSSPVP